VGGVVFGRRGEYAVVPQRQRLKRRHFVVEKTFEKGVIEIRSSRTHSSSSAVVVLLINIIMIVVGCVVVSIVILVLLRLLRLRLLLLLRRRRRRLLMLRLLDLSVFVMLMVHWIY
jgi:hypothetical protein